MGLELTTDRYPPITSQTRYPLRHAASFYLKNEMFKRQYLYIACILFFFVIVFVYKYVIQ